MKTYTLRLEDDVIKALKYLSIEENRSIRMILVDLIHKKIRSHNQEKYNKRKDTDMEAACAVLRKISSESTMKSIREDRDR